MWARGQSCFVCLMFLLLLRSVSSYLELLWLNSVELAAPYRQVSVSPRGPETAEPSVHEKCLCCQLWFPAWPLLLGCPTRPHRGPPWPFVCGPCSLWTSRSLAFHMRLCPITPFPPPQHQESLSPSLTSGWPWEREAVISELNTCLKEN